MTKETANATARTSGREEDPMADTARRILRSEMVRRGYSFKRLADELNALGDGPAESVQSLINKVNRGRFSFAFALRACRAMGMQTIALTPDEVREGEKRAAMKAE